MKYSLIVTLLITYCNISIETYVQCLGIDFLNIDPNFLLHCHVIAQTDAHLIKLLFFSEKLLITFFPPEMCLFVMGSSIGEFSSTSTHKCFNVAPKTKSYVGKTKMAVLSSTQDLMFAYIWHHRECSFANISEYKRIVLVYSLYWFRAVPSRTPMCSMWIK